MQIRQMLQCHVDKDNIKDKNQEKKYQKNKADKDKIKEIIINKDIKKIIQI